MHVNQNKEARRDLLYHFLYLGREAGIGTAKKFRNRFEETFDALARMPLMGTLVDTSRPELAGLRKWRIKEFEDFLIFYLPRKDRVEILRVIHAAQDWMVVFEDEPRE